MTAADWYNVALCAEARQNYSMDYEYWTDRAWREYLCFLWCLQIAATTPLRDQLRHAL
jgi:hypothetical protein